MDNEQINEDHVSSTSNDDNVSLSSNADVAPWNGSVSRDDHVTTTSTGNESSTSNNMDREGRDILKCPLIFKSSGDEESDFVQVRSDIDIGEQNHGPDSPEELKEINVEQDEPDCIDANGATVSEPVNAETTDNESIEMEIRVTVTVVECEEPEPVVDTDDESMDSTLEASFEERVILGFNIKMERRRGRRLTRPWICYLCLRVFRCKERLRSHARRHSGLRNYACPFCAKIVKKPETSVIHFNDHFVDKNYRCQMCTRRFARPASLMRHNEMHTQVHHKHRSRCYRWKCSECYCTFSSLIAWHKHGALGCDPMHLRRDIKLLRSTRFSEVNLETDSSAMSSSAETPICVVNKTYVEETDAEKPKPESDSNECTCKEKVEEDEQESTDEA